MIQVILGNSKVVGHLLSLHAKETKNNQGLTPVDWAAGRNQCTTLRLLLRSLPRQNRFNALLLAIEQGHLDCCKVHIANFVFQILSSFLFVLSS